MPKNGDVLLDTSIIVDHLRGKLELGAALSRAEEFFVPLPVLGELLSEPGGRATSQIQFSGLKNSCALRPYSCQMKEPRSDTRW